MTGGSALLGFQIYSIPHRSAYKSWGVNGVLPIGPGTSGAAPDRVRVTSFICRRRGSCRFGGFKYFEGPESGSCSCVGVVGPMDRAPAIPDERGVPETDIRPDMATEIYRYIR